ncbi:FMN-dependent dehydrogenase family protein, partial [Vibrio parahaemolyticus EKP-021]
LKKWHQPLSVQCGSSYTC